MAEEMLADQWPLGEMMGRLGFVILAIAISTASADAAAIQRRELAGSPDLIVVTGAIEQGDDHIFRDVAAATDQAVVLLDSEGGSVVAALEIGKAIRLRNFATFVAPDSLCASACALTWLAGSPRMLNESSRIGFHAAYVADGGKISESGVGNALIGAYLSQIGLSDQAIVFVTSAPPEGMAWLSVNDASQLGITVASVEPELHIDQPLPEFSPYDPLTTAMQFYKALEKADGDAATALVIPEKRGIGPFNEEAIHSFYGGLKAPLKLISVTLTGNNSVEVTYRYTRTGGSECDGLAVLSTTYKYGKTLISKIRAPNGC